MGLCTQALIPTYWAVDDIKNILKNHLNIESVDVEYSTGFFQLYFEYNNDKRQISMFLNSSDNSLPSHTISMGSNTNGIHIIKTIWDVCGGFFTENDCDNIYLHKKPMNSGGNTNFVLNWATIRGIINNDSRESSEIAYDEFDKHIGRKDKYI